LYTEEDANFAYEMDFYLRPQKFRHYLNQTGLEFPERVKAPINEKI
jgi:hypothetical protein